MQRQGFEDFFVHSSHEKIRAKRLFPKPPVPIFAQPEYGCMMTPFDYKYQNQSGFAFLMPIRAIVMLTPLGIQNLNKKRKPNCILVVVVKWRHRESWLMAESENTIILFLPPPQILHKHCFQFLLGLTMVTRENNNNANSNFGATNKV